jgi:hypothetical protein
MLNKNELKVGDKLIATDPCTMNGTTINALTVGKEYEIVSFEEEWEGECVLVINDQNDEHLYSIKELEKWFEVE